MATAGPVEPLLRPIKPKAEAGPPLPAIVCEELLRDRDGAMPSKLVGLVIESKLVLTLLLPVAAPVLDDPIVIGPPANMGDETDVAEADDGLLAAAIPAPTERRASVALASTESSTGRCWSC